MRLQQLEIKHFNFPYNSHLKDHIGRCQVYDAIKKLLLSLIWQCPLFMYLLTSLYLLILEACQLGIKCETVQIYHLTRKSKETKQCVVEKEFYEKEHVAKTFVFSNFQETIKSLLRTSDFEFLNSQYYNLPTFLSEHNFFLPKC